MLIANSFSRNLTIKIKSFSFLTNLNNIKSDRITMKINKNILNNFKTIKNKPFLNKQKFNFSQKDEIEMPDHLKYDIPKYNKNPDNVDFPWLIGGAPYLELKVY